MSDRQSARETLKRLIDAYNRKDRAALADLYAEDVMLWSSLGEDTSGRDSVLEHVQQLFTALPDERMRADTVVTDGDTIVAEFTSSGTDVNEEPYEIQFTEVFELSAGQFKEIRIYIDPDVVEAISH